MKKTDFPILISQGMFKKKKKIISSKTKFMNSIFNKNITHKQFKIDKETVIKITNELFPLKSSRLLVKCKILENLNKILNSLLLNEPISESIIFSLSNVEDECLKLFLLRKKMIQNKDEPITQAVFNQIYQNPKSKRIEENLKFIFKKLVRFLQEVFKRKVYPYVQEDLLPEYAQMKEPMRFEYAFYGYYFGKVALQINHRIEKFFHPRNKRNSLDQNNKFISKTISKLYVKYVSMSPLFVRDLSMYLRHGLLLEIRHTIINKVNRMCLNWESKLAKNGSDWLLHWIQNNFQNNTKCKQAWSLQEVSLAKDQILALVAKN
jgi:hypothetical protein